MACQNNVGNTKNSSSFSSVTVIVLYILLAIVLGSWIW